MRNDAFIFVFYYTLPARTPHVRMRGGGRGRREPTYCMVLTVTSQVLDVPLSPPVWPQPSLLKEPRNPLCEISII
jgi:hypothetical protein